MNLVEFGVDLESPWHEGEALSTKAFDQVKNFTPMLGQPLGWTLLFCVYRPHKTSLERVCRSSEFVITRFTRAFVLAPVILNMNLHKKRKFYRGLGLVSLLGWMWCEAIVESVAWVGCLGGCLSWVLGALAKQGQIGVTFGLGFSCINTHCYRPHLKQF